MVAEQNREWENRQRAIQLKQVIEDLDCIKEFELSHCPKKSENISLEQQDVRVDHKHYDDL